MRGVEQTVVHHLERDAGFDERLVVAEGVVLDFGAGAFAAVEMRGLLRVDHADAGERLFVAEVALVAVVPVVEILDDGSASGRS